MPTDLTNGWDTIVAIHTDSLNIGLDKAYAADLLPRGINKEFQFVLFGKPLLDCALDCDMAAWQIAGGTGENVTIDIPLTKGELTLAPVPDDPSAADEQDVITYPIEDWTLAVTVNLSRIDNHVEASPTDEVKSDIIIDFQKNTFVSLSLIADSLSPSDRSSIETVLNATFKSFISDASYTIATVDLHYLEENYPYIVPKNFKYGIEYHVGEAGKEIGTFAVMMQTISAHEGSSALQYGVVPNLPPYCNSSAICSNEIFIKQIALPQLKKILGLAPNSTLLIAEPAGTEQTFKIVSKGTLKTKIDKYDVSLSSVLATLDNGVVVNAVGSTKLLGIFIINFDAKFVSELTYDPENQILNFIVDKGRSYYDTKVSLVWWIKLIQILLVAFFFAFAGTVAGFTLLFTFMLMNTLIEIVANDIAKKVVKGSLPDVIPAHVNWKYEEYLEIQQINLSTPLQVGTFAPSLEPASGQNVAGLLDDQSAYNDLAALNAETFVRYDDRVELVMNRAEFETMFEAEPQEQEVEIERQTITVSIERFSDLAKDSDWTPEQIQAAEALFNPIEDYLFDHVFTRKDRTMAFINDPLAGLSEHNLELDEEALQNFVTSLKPLL